MARRIPRDCSAPEWVANPYIEVRQDVSLIREGFLDAEFFLPIAPAIETLTDANYALRNGDVPVNEPFTVDVEKVRRGLDEVLGRS